MCESLMHKTFIVTVTSVGLALKTGFYLQVSRRCFSFINRITEGKCGGRNAEEMRAFKVWKKLKLWEKKSLTRKSQCAAGFGSSSLRLVSADKRLLRKDLTCT